VRRGFRLVIDEVYREYATGGGLRAPAAALSPAVISVSSLTKIYGLGALRCGWIIAAPDAILPIRDMNARVEFGMSTLSHTVAAHVLAAPGAFDAHSRDYVRSSRPVFEAWFSRMVEDGLMAGLLPDDGCICFPSLPGIADTKSFSEWLIARSGVIVAPGEYFGAPGHVRIGFCQPQDKLESGLAMLEDALRRYRADAVRPQ